VTIKNSGGLSCSKHGCQKDQLSKFRGFFPGKIKFSMTKQTQVTESSDLQPTLLAVLSTCFIAKNDSSHCSFRKKQSPRWLFAE